jgi:hypothetical protein
LTVFAAFILTCGFVDSETGEITYTDVEYSPDGTSITIYLDGSAPVRSDRALTKSLAILAHDFFEVAFMYDSGAGYIIARGSWELGQSAGVSGVYRTLPVDYGYITSAPIPNATPLQGSAILFAGKKTDRTLLAVGRLCAVDGQPGTTINSNTKSISFELNALKAGTNSEAEDSSFWTNPNSAVYPNNGNSTKVTEFSFKYRLFPLFGFTKGIQNNRAVYNLGVHSTQGGNISFGTYRPGIIVAAGAVCTNVEPHYTLTTATEGLPGSTTSIVYKMGMDPKDTFKWWNTVTPPVTPPPVTLGNNTTAGMVFQNGVQFAIDTRGANDRDLISITFEIPVYPLSLDGLIVDLVSDPVVDNRWWIRPGYDEYLNELDNGEGNGGAILIGIGDLDLFVGYRLTVKKMPNKTQYNEHTNYLFSYAGLEVELEDSDGHSLDTIANGLLTYDVHDKDKNYIGTVNNGSDISLLLPSKNGRLWIVISYDHPVYGLVKGGYWINVNPLDIDFEDIPYNRRYVISVWDDWNSLQEGTKITSGVYLLVFTQSINLSDLTITLTGDLTLVMTANGPDIIIGREGNNTFRVDNWNCPYNITLYCGTWPFNEPTLVGGDVLEDYPYSFNSIGLYQNFGQPTAGAVNNLNTKIINRYNGTPTGTLRSFIGDDVDTWGTLLTLP